MASEIKVDTISEKTSAGGVTIDGLLIKDGGISGDVSLIGTTPTFTIGDAGAEDAALVFDGNAQDYYIALDDSADDLLIGLGSTVGTTPAIAIDENLKVNIPVTTASTSASTGSLTTGGGAGIGADLYVGDDTYLITDSAVLGFGADKDTTLTHTDGTGLTLNSTNKLCFNDASQFVQGSSATVLSIGATDEIDLTATAIDINGTCDVSGTFSLGGTNMTATAAELNLLDGGTSVGSSITLADADGFVVNDGGTMKTIPATDIPTYVGGGISQADSWGISSATAIEDAFITSNWFNATEGGVPLGSALTESSGVFSFPSTGFYLINYQFTCQSSSSNYAFTSVYCSMHWTEDNSSYGLLAATFPVIPAIGSSNVYNSASHSIIIDVVNTTNVKFKFKIRAYSGAGTQALTVHGATTGLHSGFTCVRLADT